MSSKFSRRRLPALTSIMSFVLVSVLLATSCGSMVEQGSAPRTNQDGQGPDDLDSDPVDPLRADVADDQSRAAVRPRPEPEVGSTIGGVTLTESRSVQVVGGNETVVGFDNPPPTVVVAGADLAELSIRYHTDREWSEWTEIPDLDDESPDGVNAGSEGSNSPSPAFGPVWLDGRTDAIALRSSGDRPVDARILGLDPSGAPAERTVSPAGPSRTELTVAAAAASPIRALGAAAVTAPTINERDSWASAGWASGQNGCGRAPGKADYIAAGVVHHTVTGNTYTRDQVDDQLRSIYYTHVVINGWCDIGYNFVVDRFGGIWEARTGSLSGPVIGGHAKGFNTSTVGVAMLGQHQTGVSPAVTSPSTATETAVRDLLHWRLGQYGVDPAGTTWLRNYASSPPLKLKGETWHLLPTIMGHRDLGLTSCPGDLGYSMVKGLPSALVARRDLSLPYRFDRWTPRRHGPGFLTADNRGGLRPASTAELPTAAGGAVADPASVVAVDGDHGGGYRLTTTGELIPFGQAAGVAPVKVEGPIDVEVRSGGGGWVLGQSGAIVAFGPAPRPAAASVPVNSPAVALALDDDGRGWVLERSGVIHAVGTGDLTPPVLDKPLPSGTQAVDLAVVGYSGDSVARGSAVPRPQGWVVDSAGAVRGFGGASTTTVNSSVTPVAVAIADGEPGGWIIDSAGRYWAFSGARLIRPLSTDVTRSNVVDGAQLGIRADSDFLVGADARYVYALYQLLNGRMATVAEVSRGVAQLEDGEGRLAITDRLVRSRGWAGLSIDTVYRDVLGRNPDAAGRQYWLDQIAAGLRYEDLGVYFYGSEEYAARAGGDREYVALLYRVLLGRDGEADGIDYWTEQLGRPGVGPPTVAHSFYLSIESRRDRVTDLYQRILGRTPSSSEREYWAGQLLDLDDVAMAAELSASAEYYRKAVEG